MDLNEARSILGEIMEHDTPDAAEACRTVLAALDGAPVPAVNYVRMNLGLASGERVDAWVDEKDAVRIWHA